MGDFKFEVWPTEYQKITQYFGANPRNYAQFGLPGHEGIDIRALSGSKVYCVAPGEVFRIHDKPTGHNYGIHVRVQHQDGYRTIYAHLQKALVSLGQIVEAGTVLGLADNTGNSFGSHLHLTLKREGAKLDNWPNNIIDPTPFLLPLLGWQEPAGPYIEGWVLADSMVIREELAQVNAGGATLYIGVNLKKLIPAGTIIAVTGSHEPYKRVRVALAAIGLTENKAPTPSPEPPPIVATIDGYAWKHYLIYSGKQAIVGSHGVDLRVGPDRSATNIGMVKASSTVSILGLPVGNYLPIRVRRNDFVGPVNLPELPPDPEIIPPEEGYLGWVLTQYLSPLGNQRALTSRLGVNLRSRPDTSGQNLGLLKAYVTVSIAGAARGVYTPVLTRKIDLLNPLEPLPDVELPESLGKDRQERAALIPIPDTTPGWVFSNNLEISGDKAKVNRYGNNLRAAPRRDARKIGYIPPETALLVTGPAQGEYVPVRLREDLLEPPTEGGEDPEPDTISLGQARIGLHASADPHISAEEHKEFTDLRPGIIKVLSFHSPLDIERLATAHPQAHWIVRAFLAFGGRQISPDQFLKYTVGDVRRALDALQGKRVVVELHNEPNLVDEGLGSSWSDGASFGFWWLDLLRRYRLALPGVRFIYPGLSPGSTVSGVKLDHIRFLEMSRAAAEAANGLGVHIYWSHVLPMSQGLEIVDDYISRFRATPIWITEASRKGDHLPTTRVAQEYLRFWRELQTRPVVQGITYFVASASNPDFAHQVWLGKGLGKLVGNR